MSLTDELTQLAALKQSGALTETEFQQAKAKLLNPSRESDDARRHLPQSHDKSLGEAANRYVSFRMIMTVVSLIVFLIFFAPIMCRQSNGFGGSTIQLR